MKNQRKEKQTAFNWLEENKSQVFEIVDKVYLYAEPALREYQSAKVHMDFLRKHGFEVEEGISKMPTAFKATAGSGKPVIGFYAEYDATPGNSQKSVTHRCPEIPQGAGFEDAHNALGAGSTAAAVAARMAQKEHGLPGTIEIFGAPAEKLCIAKPYQARDGYYDNLDAAVCWHPWGYNTCTYDSGPTCYESVIFEFFGIQSYGGHPWRGASAMDGATTMNVLVNYQKEHIPRDFLASVNEIMTVGGQCCTNIPEYTQVWYVIRATTRKAIEEIHEMLERCARAAALATNCEWKCRMVAGTRPWLINHTMAELAFSNLKLAGAPKFTEEDKEFARKLQAAIGITPMKEPFDLELRPPQTEAAYFIGGADDVTEFAWSAPTCWIHTAYMFLGSERNFDLPSWAVAALAGTNVARQNALTGAKAMAMTAVDLLLSPEILKKAREEYDQRTEGKMMLPVLPKDVDPPVEALYSFPPFFPNDFHPPVGRDK